MTIIIQDMILEEIIRPKKNSYSSHVLLVCKKDDTWSCCMDYCVINVVVVCDYFPIHTIEEHFDKFGCAYVFIKRDLR